jgi:hypothetical protein
MMSIKKQVDALFGMNKVHLSNENLYYMQLSMSRQKSQLCQKAFKDFIGLFLSVKFSFSIISTEEQQRYQSQSYFSVGFSPYFL